MSRRPRRVVVQGYCHEYIKKIIDEAAGKLGSVRKVSFALGLSQAQMYRYYHDETRMSNNWVQTIEDLLKKLS